MVPREEQNNNVSNSCFHWFSEQVAQQIASVASMLQCRRTFQVLIVVLLVIMSIFLNSVLYCTSCSHTGLRVCVCAHVWGHFLISQHGCCVSGDARLSICACIWLYHLLLFTSYMTNKNTLFACVSARVCSCTKIRILLAKQGHSVRTGFRSWSGVRGQG